MNSQVIHQWFFFKHWLLSLIIKVIFSVKKIFFRKYRQVQRRKKKSPIIPPLRYHHFKYIGCTMYCTVLSLSHVWLFCNPIDIASEKAMAPHSSTLAWKIPWTEEPGRLQSMGSLRVRHDWATSLSLFTFMHWRTKWQPTPVFLPGEPQGRGSLVAAVYGVTQSRTRLKWLSIA